VELTKKPYSGPGAATVSRSALCRRPRQLVRGSRGFAFCCFPLASSIFDGSFPFVAGPTFAPNPCTKKRKENWWSNSRQFLQPTKSSAAANLPCDIADHVCNLEEIPTRAPEILMKMPDGNGEITLHQNCVHDEMRDVVSAAVPRKNFLFCFLGRCFEGL